MGCIIKGDKAEGKELAMEVERRLERRRRTQPVDLPSCGSVFRNPGEDVSAAQLIQEAGLKGTRSGDAVISEIHANFIVNEGNARATDILSLMALARGRVRDRSGVNLIPEVRIAGYVETLEVILDAWKKDNRQ